MVARSYASWLAECLKKYFEALGFKFYYEIQTQPRENDYPFDVWAKVKKGDLVKRFGLQVKRPDQSKKDPDVFLLKPVKPETLIEILKEKLKGKTSTFSTH